MTEFLLLLHLWSARIQPVLDTAERLPALAAAPTPDTHLPDVDPALLHDGDVIESLASDPEPLHRFTLDIPPNTARLELRLRGGTGDADLYLRADSEPDLSRFDARPFVRGNHETILLDTPRPGPWHLMIHAARPFRDVSLSVRLRMEDIDTETASPLAGADLDLSLYYELSGIAMDRETLSAELRNQALRDEGRQAFTNGDYDRAISLWSQWAELDPANPEPVSLIGDTYLRMEDPARAVQQYRQSLRIQPGQITLMVRLARLIDQHLNQPDEARILLNRYSRIFPYHPEIALAQAEWLLRRKRYDEATELIHAVIENDPDNLQARTLLHGLLRTPRERFDNLKAMLHVGEQSARQWILAQAIQDYNLLIRPESWVLMDFVDRMQYEASTRAQRARFRTLMPRSEPARENFRLGRMSSAWISSQEQQWNEDGSLVLSADPSQTEAFLRLDRSDAMHNGFIEASIEATRGFFWLYARRGEGNMIRFGFDETGMMYQQVWMNGQLLANQSRLWSRPDTAATLRLEVRSDGVFATIDGRPAFSSPLTIPHDMGLGWWGLAPWSPDMGRAAVTIREVAGGPLPVLFGLGSQHITRTLPGRHPRAPGLQTAYPHIPLPPRSDAELARLQDLVQHLSLLAPDWYTVTPLGLLQPSLPEDDQELRLLARFHRVRILPRIRYPRLRLVPWDHLAATARRDRLDGFTILLPKMPPDDEIAALEDAIFASGLEIVLAVHEPARDHILLREVKAGVALLPGPRRAHRLPLTPLPAPDEPFPPSTTTQSRVLSL